MTRSMDCNEKSEVPHGNTVFVRNLPYTTSSSDLGAIFSEVGPVKEAFVVKNKDSDDKCRGFGYVKFGLKEDAEAATKKTFKHDGRKLSILFAKKKKKQGKKDKTEHMQDDEGKVKTETQPERKQEKKFKPSCTVVLTGFREDTNFGDVENLVTGLRHYSSLTFPVPGRSDPTAFAFFKFKNDAAQAVKKLSKSKLENAIIEATLLSDEHFEKKLSKKGRLVIRNLSFNCKEDQLKKLFAKYGTLTEVTIPKRNDGKMCGFAFVNFDKVPAAAQALKELNGSLVNKRPIAVDWAIAREKFEELKKNVTADDVPPEIKTERVSSDDESATSMSENEEDSDSGSEAEELDESQNLKRKASMEESESDDDDDDSDSELGDIKNLEAPSSDSENDEDEDSADFESDASGSSGSEMESRSEMSDSELDSDDESGISFDSDSDDSERKMKAEKKKRKKGDSDISKPSDVDEGKTLFIRNVPYDAEEEDLQEVLSKFGELQYCRIVMDEDTDHSKGCAFVKFKEINGAKFCLKVANDEVREGIIMDGKQLNITYALSKQKAQELQNVKKDKLKQDKRNLYLVREGMIRPGTKAAEGLSQADLAKRNRVEITKKQKLKNPNIFISRTRLCVHNIPIRVTDAELRKLCLKYANDKRAKVTECRIIRDLEVVNAEGIAKSRGYAFVNFTEHDNALTVLRALNNNPEIYGDHKRLIVEFSLENRLALEAKQKRLERSKAKQNMFKGTKVKTKPKKQGKQDKGLKANKVEKAELLDAKKVDQLVDEHQRKKGPKGLPSHWGPKIRHKARNNPASVRAKKNKVPQTKNTASVKRKNPEKERPNKRRKNVKEERDRFDKLVDKHRKQISAATLTKTGSKWFS